MWRGGNSGTWNITLPKRELSVADPSIWQGGGRSTESRGKSSSGNMAYPKEEGLVHAVMQIILR